MESWFNRIAYELEDLLRGRCEYMDDLIDHDVLRVQVLQYDKTPKISFLLLSDFQMDNFDVPFKGKVVATEGDEGNIYALEIKYNQVEEYFFYEFKGDEEGNNIRVVLNNTESLLDFIHSRVHNIMDMGENEGVITGDGRVFQDEDDFLEHFNSFAKEREESDSNLKDVEWFSNIESIAKMDVPKKKEMKSIIEFGVNEFKKEFAIKKSLLVRGESDEYIAGEAQLSYLIINKEEAKQIIEELQKYTAS
ncbi:hypothetical protein [Priestia megaterium]|uniref:Uncharacterized protein n=1 Tax=Priestia megaterium TaxID=1404 RepID=A0A6M6E221_PRIMG|nr:hypothetical protein [Priestia megaterium]QJX81002.1 hypothetical protein FDZ14_33470 [Priestia megaterium]